MTFNEWASCYPEAAIALMDVVSPAVSPPDAPLDAPEAWAQQQARFDIARQGASSWRNNVGATPAKVETVCPRCAFDFYIKQQPVRYGLANDSAKLNKQVKSSDLILAIPRKITPDMVGSTIAQFGSVEVKRPGWVYTGKQQEPAQAAWLALVNRLGGFGVFSTGKVEL